MKSGEVLFVESSALVAWALWEARGPEVAKHLRKTSILWLSALAVPECLRALARAAALGRVDAPYMKAARKRLSVLESGCRVVPVDAEILERAGREFAVEPFARLTQFTLLPSNERARLPRKSRCFRLMTVYVRTRSRREYPSFLDAGGGSGGKG